MLGAVGNNAGGGGARIPFWMRGPVDEVFLLDAFLALAVALVSMSEKRQYLIERLPGVRSL